MGNDASIDTAVRQARQCRACGQLFNPDTALSLGRLPVCNRFACAPDPAPQSWPLAMNECMACGLLQLSESPPVTAIVPQLPWIKYNEPEAHLDHLADRITALSDAGRRTVLGIGPFDKPLLDRLESKAWASRQADLLSEHPVATGFYPYLETLQSCLRPDAPPFSLGVDNAGDLICCRYLLEHCTDPVRALRALENLLTPDGLILIEVPDSTKFLSRQDYSFVWEEHICYFTEASFRAFADLAGYDVAAFFRYDGALEDALVFLLRPAARREASDRKPASNNLPISPYPLYRDGFASTRQRYLQALEGLQATGQRVALFGAGHQSIMFANLFIPKGRLAAVVDDHPQKVGCRIPGTDVTIISSAQFDDNPDIGICLLGVNPSIEEKIRAKSIKFLNRGGLFYSIFPDTPTATLIDSTFV